VFNPSVESGDAVLQIKDQEVWYRCDGLGGLAWSRFLIWVWSLLTAMGSAQVRMVRTKDPGVSPGPDGGAMGIDGISPDRLGEAFGGLGDHRQVQPDHPGPRTRII